MRPQEKKHIYGYIRKNIQRKNIKLFFFEKKKNVNLKTRIVGKGIMMSWISVLTYHIPCALTTVKNLKEMGFFSLLIGRSILIKISSKVKSWIMHYLIRFFLKKKNCLKMEIKQYWRIPYKKKSYVLIGKKKIV